MSAILPLLTKPVINNKKLAKIALFWTFKTFLVL